MPTVCFIEVTEDESTVDESAEDKSVAAASDSTVDSCNGENGVVEMKVTLRGHTGTYEGIDENGQGTFGVDQLEKKFEGDWLILEKVFGGDECTKIQVDGTKVCSAVHFRE